MGCDMEGGGGWWVRRGTCMGRGEEEAKEGEGGEGREEI